MQASVRPRQARRGRDVLQDRGHHRTGHRLDHGHQRRRRRQVYQCAPPLFAKFPAPRIVNTSSARGSLSFAAGLPPRARAQCVEERAELDHDYASAQPPWCLRERQIEGERGEPVRPKAAVQWFHGNQDAGTGGGCDCTFGHVARDGISGQLVGDHAPFSEKGGDFAQIL
ncbi:hypothetical protein FIBSPDRAFT_258308 [Athelia psychrophila]|uniref:Uncharacterized protein n=1 Tax=Athelia psychrophila TaxID=1759441 RepID=A0A166RLP6_9AGAM|nr:hypothetical protein FIBSPDRAFT_258308 [Fibularhizoctonia sp. CBS 109695]